MTVKGKPVAALTPIGPHSDLENLAVSNDPQFRALIQRSRRRHPAGSGLTTAQGREMEDIAWILRTDAKRKRIGFIQARQLEPKDRYVLPVDDDW